MREQVLFEVDGRQYGGMESLSVSRSIAQASGAFSVAFTDLWPGQDQKWPILPHEPVRILLGETVLLNGFVDMVPIDISKDAHVMSAAGRDRTGQLMDCDPYPNPAEYRNTRLDKLARALCRRINLDVVVDVSANDLERLEVVRPTPGQTIYRMLAEQAVKDNVLLGCNGDGALRLFRPGTEQAEVALVYGENIKSATLENDWSDRYSRYMVEGQSMGFDVTPDAAAQVRGQACDESVTLPRFKRFRADSAMDNLGARKKAQWEASTRAARSVSLSVPMRGWRQDPDAASSPLWREGLLVDVDIPPLKLHEQLLVESVAYAFGSTFGCTLRLTRPDAWKPAPPKPEKDPLIGEGWPNIYG